MTQKHPIPTPLERMAPELRMLGATHCRLRVCMQLPEAMRGDTLEIHQVWTEPEFRNQGSATKLLRQICLEADTENITLILQAQAFKGGQDGLCQSLLETWYREAFGFQVVQKSPTVMIRPVVPKPDEPEPSK